MAEIKDVYSLEFNSSQFQTEINSAIESIDQLNSAMEQGVDVADDLEAAQANLVSVLNTEAKGVEQLNQKRDTLVKTQKQVNAESKTGVAVGKQLDTTNKQIAVSTGQAATQQKNLGSQLFQGAKNINSMRRAGMMLGNVFRLLGGFNPFGLIATALPTVISYASEYLGLTQKQNEEAEKQQEIQTQLISTYFDETRELNNLFGALNEANKGRGNKKAIIEELQNKYPEYLKNIDLETASAEQLAAAYDKVAISILRSIVQKQAQKEQEEVVNKIIQKQVELNQAVSFATTQEEERLRLIQQYQDVNASMGLTTTTIQAPVNKIKAEIQTLTGELSLVNAKYANLAEDLYKSIGRVIDPKNLTGSFNATAAQSSKIAQTNKKKSESALRQILKINKEVYDNIEKNIKKSSKVITDINKKRIKDEEEYQQMLEDSIKKRNDSLDELNDRLTKQSENNINNLERELFNELNFLEQSRNEKLKAFENNAEEQEKINKDFDKRRLDLENKANIKILESRIKLLNDFRKIAVSTKDENLIGDIDKQISELNLKITELGKTAATTTEQTKGLTDKQKELIEQSAQLIQGVSDNVFNVLNAQVQAYIEGLDKAIDKSKSALDEIRSNSENYNARQLEIEKERLEKLEAERARAVEREKNLAQVQIAINASIAISKALIEGGGFASAITVGLTIASLIAGLAQARAAAGNAFYQGVEYLERGQNKAGRDTIPAMLNEGERVITTDTNNKYWDVLSAVHNNRIPADVLNTFSKAYQQGGIKNALGAFGDNVSLSSELGQKSIFVNVAQTYGGLENRLERIENVLTELPKYMPRTTVSANANGIFRIVEQRQARKNFSKNWSK
jgi:hypothetical protein